MTKGSKLVQGRLKQLLSDEESSTTSPRWMVQLTGNGFENHEADQTSLRRVVEGSTISSDTDSANLVSSSDGDEGLPIPVQQKRVSFSADAKTGPPSQPSAFRRKRRAGVSSRGVKVSRPANTRKRKNVRSTPSRKKTKANPTKQVSDGPVTKVQMKTGTLYMYGGPNRRAEFVTNV